jgi:hypothetical protein
LAKFEVFESFPERFVTTNETCALRHFLRHVPSQKIRSAGAHEVLIAQAEALAVSAAEIAEWQQGGQLYLDFYRVREELKAEAEEREADLVRGRTLSNAVCFRVPWFLVHKGPIVQGARVVMAEGEDRESHLVKHCTAAKLPA